MVKAHVATSPKLPETVLYRGEGTFMVSGHVINPHRKFKRRICEPTSAERSYRDHSRETRAEA